MSFTKGGEMKGIRWLVVLALMGAVIGGAWTALADEQKTVTWAHIWGGGTQRQQVTATIAQFEAANPDVKVEEIILDSATWQPKIRQMLAGNEPPDVFLWFPGPLMRELADLEVIAPLTEMWETYGIDYFIPEGFKAESTHKGDLWMLPWGYMPTVVLYNKHIFGELQLDIPTTIGDFERICETVKDAGYYPLGSGWSSAWRSSYAPELLITSYGGPDLYQSLMEMEVDWGNETCREAYAHWKDWVENGYWYPDSRSRRWQEGLSLFLNDECAMYTLGVYGVAMVEESGWVLGQDFDAFVFPQEDLDYPPSLTGSFEVWCMSAKAPHPVEAQRLLAFLASTRAQTNCAIYEGGMACNRFVDAYNSVGLMVQDAVNRGAVFHPVMGIALPPSGIELINKRATVDFYYDPDIEGFIAQCEAARAQYWAEKEE